MITRNDAVRLLALAARSDQRTVADEDVDDWHAVGRIERWTFPAAARVIVEHYSRGADRPRVTPAAITDRLRSLRGGAAESFEAPRIPDGLPNRDYPAWLRAQLAEHIDAAMDGWVETGQEPSRALPAAPPAIVRAPHQLVDAAPVRHRPAIEAGIKTMQARRVRLDPDRRAQVLAELDAARACQTAEPPAEAAG